MSNVAQLCTVTQVHPIEGADWVDRVLCSGGVQVVVTKGTLSIDDTVVFFPPRVVLPTSHDVFSDCTQYGDRVINYEGFNIRGYVVVPRKIQGCVSQGVVKKACLFPGLKTNIPDDQVSMFFLRMGVFPFPVKTTVYDSGKRIGKFPTDVVKKQRWKNIDTVSDDFFNTTDKDLWVPIERMGGMAATFWKAEGVLHAASKNYEVQWNDDHRPNVFGEMVKKYQLDTNMCDGQVIQGEIYGQGIRGNHTGIQGRKLSVYTTQGFSNDSPFVKVIEALRAPIVSSLDFPRDRYDAHCSVQGCMSATYPHVGVYAVSWVPLDNRTPDILDGSHGVSVLCD